MLKIGDFSKLSLISVRMLRYYDDLNLLKPDKVDPYTGYRYYSETKLVAAGRINALKNMGFGVSDIALILNQYSDPCTLQQFLSQKLAETENEIKSLKQKTQIINNTIEWLRKDGNIMGYEISIKTLPQRYVASVRQTLPHYQDEGRLWEILCAETDGLNMQRANPPYTMVIYHDGEYKESNIDMEAQTAVLGKYSDTEHVKFKTASAVEYAGAVFKGGYDKIGQANAAIAQWISDNGYELTGMPFNIYYVSPNDTDNPEEYVTEVCYPVKRI